MEQFYENTLTLFDLIQEDMEVLDTDNERVGKVKFVQYPSESVNPSLSEFPYDLTDRDIPDEMAYRFVRSGFITVNAGWLAKDRIVFPEQIDIVGETVYLSVKDKDLYRI